MRSSRRFVLSTAIAFPILWAGMVYAKDAVIVNTNPTEPSVSDARVLSLGPVVNSLLAPDTSAVTADAEPGPHAHGARTLDTIVNSPKAFGSFGIPYTTTRVQEGKGNGDTGPSRLSATYPYRTIGKLTLSGGYCSASLIRRSVIVTAAHCIQPFGSGSSTFSNWQFKPGHYGATGATAAQIAPYGIWNWLSLVRPATWAIGTDVGSGAARDNDLAVFALAKNAQGQFIGDITDLWMEQLFILDVPEDGQPEHRSHFHAGLSLSNGRWRDYAAYGWANLYHHRGRGRTALARKQYDRWFERWPVGS